jgi:hypothetical protein
MSSAHHTIFLKDFVIEQFVDLYDENGNPTNGQITSSGNYLYTQAFTIPPKSVDHILTAVCEGCTIEILFQMSPDGVNWCDCILGNGSTCEFECTANVGDCTTKVIDVPVLGYGRIKIGNAGSVGGVCTVRLNYSLE